MSFCCIRMILYSRRRRCRCTVLGLGTILVYYIYCYVSYLNLHNNYLMDLKNNYFQFEEELTRNLLIDSETCRIPDFPVSVESGHSKVNCGSKLPRLTYTVGDKVVVDVDVLKRKLGYNWNSIICCYRAITRAHHNEDGHDDLDADNQIRYSEDCIQMGLATRPKVKFIKVTCSRKWSLFGATIYEKFHALSVITSPEVQKKINFWKLCLNQEHRKHLRLSEDNIELCHKMKHTLPPNVLVVGIGSTSRLNFRRLMNRTVTFLTRLKAVEMKGYSTVGESTLQNVFPLLTSLPSVTNNNCSRNSSDWFDDCPFIWKQFSGQNYLTAYLEDAPRTGHFNFIRPGFSHEPVDVYFRPLALAMYHQKGKFLFSQDCSGYERPDEMILNYTVDLMKTASRQKLPAFVTTWLADLTRDDPHKLEQMDNTLTTALETLYENGILQNTVLIVTSDRGYRPARMKTTLSEWYEGKLPLMWIGIPFNKRKEWGDPLVRNSRELTTPYDIHTTLAHVLQSNVAEKDTPFEKYGICLFSNVNSTRTCSEAGIPFEFCPCDLPVKFEGTNVLRTAALAVIQEINNLVPEEECLQLQLGSVLIGGVMKNKKGTSLGFAGLSTLDRLIIGFMTTPGQFVFEAIVEYDQSVQKFSNVSYFIRLDSPRSHVDCVEHVESRHTSFCFCSNWDSFWMPKILTDSW